MQGTCEANAIKTSAINSRRRKYFIFAAKYNSQIPSLIPIFPLRLKDLMRYMLYLASDEGNVKAGWASCLNHCTEIVTMGRLRGWEDPREGTRNQFLWGRFRSNFKTQIQVVRKAPPKLRLTPAHLQAIACTLNPARYEEHKWAAAFTSLWHSNCRVGHVAPKSAGNTHQVWKYEDLVFSPSIHDAQNVVVHFRASKTRAITEDRSFWTALGKVPLQQGQPNTCAVRLLSSWVLRSYKGDPQDPVFGSESNPKKPTLRGDFTKKLRQCLLDGARYLKPPHDKLNPKSFSGVSFRRGSLSAMSGVVEFNRLRERADHKCATSTSHYVVDSVETRAQSSIDVHARFGSAITQAAATPQHAAIRLLPVWHRTGPAEDTSAMVMIPMDTQSEPATLPGRENAAHEVASDRLDYVTIPSEPAPLWGQDRPQPEPDISSPHEEAYRTLVNTLPPAALEYSWTHSTAAVRSWLASGTCRSSLTTAYADSNTRIVAAHFTSKAIASLFRALATAQKSATAPEGLKEIGKMPTWSTARHLNTLAIAGNTHRKDVRAWQAALAAACDPALVSKLTREHNTEQAHSSSAAVGS